MERIKNKLINLKRANKKLKDGLEEYKNNTNELLRDGIIQRFEFTFELTWKTLKIKFEEEGLIGLNSPKSVLKEAFSAGLIADDKLWLNMLFDRNKTTYIYDEQIAVDICENINKKYAKNLEKLLNILEDNSK